MNSALDGSFDTQALLTTASVIGYGKIFSLPETLNIFCGNHSPSCTEFPVSPVHCQQ